jgi:mRNA degradation ribonuclease J1/J2
MIPGNEKRVIRLMNQIANCGTSIKLGSVEGLHTSGHAFSGELQEVRNHGSCKFKGGGGRL